MRRSQRETIMPSGISVGMAFLCLAVCVALTTARAGSTTACGNDVVHREGAKMSAGEPKRKVLKGVPKLVWGGMGTPTDDLMVVSALKVCLDYVGETYSKTYLAGTSAAAFETGWARSTIHSGAGGAVFAHPNHCEGAFENLFRAIGREYSIGYRSEPSNLWTVAVRSIDAGRPVTATEWKVDHYAILAGYDPDKREFLGRRYGSRDEVPEEYVPIRLDEIGYVLAIGETRTHISPKQAVLGAFRFAVSSGRTGRNTKARGQGGTSHEMVYGPEAFAEHARLIPDQLKPDLDSFGLREHFLFWRLDALHLARGYAVLYLQETLQCLPQSATKHIKTAIEKYCELLGMIESANIQKGPTYQLGSFQVLRSTPYVDIFPADPEKLGSALAWSDGESELGFRQFLRSVEGKQRFADWLLRIRDLDNAALNALAKVVKEEK